jgi:hypothetical protein
MIRGLERDPFRMIEAIVEHGIDPAEVARMSSYTLDVVKRRVCDRRRYSDEDWHRWEATPGIHANYLFEAAPVDDPAVRNLIIGFAVGRRGASKDFIRKVVEDVVRHGVVLTAEKLEARLAAFVDPFAHLRALDKE